MKNSDKVTIKVTFNGVALINDTMNQEELNLHLKNSFKSLMRAANDVTSVENRKGLNHILEVNGEKCNFKGGRLGSSMVKALILNQIAQSGGKLRLADYRETVKDQISALPISGRTVEAIRVFDKFVEGTALHSDVKKVLTLPAPKKPTKAASAKVKAETITTEL